MKTQPAILMLIAISLAAPVVFGADTITKPQNHGETTNFVSVFTIPSSLNEGRDPFFPESTRVIDAMMAANQAKAAAPAVEITALKVLGISGTSGHLLAIINNHTFGAGDQGEVLTPSGKILVHCLEVNSDHVSVLVNGQFHQLKLEQP